MAEYAGLAYYAEVPVVIWDVQRVGPSTGLPTRTAQGDLTFAHFMGHGDSQHVILLPGTVDECFEFGWKALDLAERLQAPILVLSDLDLGMNQWMTNPFTIQTPNDRGCIMRRYRKLRRGTIREIDGDGILSDDT
jgi:2-oxoglutarate ferredoxin oxidoreductase subunit alpha